MKVLSTLCTIAQIYLLFTSTIDVTCGQQAPTVAKLRNIYLSNLNSTNVTDVKIIPNSRTIQRLMGGHIQHHQDFDVQQQGNIGDNSKKIRNSKIYFRRKPASTPPSSTNVYPNIFYANRDLLDDAVFLNDHKIDSVNNELTSASAGAGPELSTTQNNNGTKDANKKTLSDQIAEGKYGLIQKELFQKPSKRPGIISYAKNPEVPQDTQDNYGGLEQEDIWLAEDHLLVLKGGGLNKKDFDEPWTPIDDYQAPRRQVKIPDNPKVPPPFPVQLGDNEPIQFIGNNQFPGFNPFQNDQIYFGETQKNISFDSNKTYLPPGYGPFENITTNNGYAYPPPIPPWLFNNNNQAFQNPFLNNSALPPNFFPPPFPPSAPLDERNITEPFDEDDPRLYYPPPYSFEYKSNYTNPVAPGPLVPGIVLPPPPNFFGRVSNKKNTPTTPTTKLVSAITEIYAQQLRPVSNQTKTYNSVPVTQRIPARVAPTTTKSSVKYKNNNLPQFIDTPRITTTTLRPVIDQNQVPEVVNFVPKIATKNHVLTSNKGNPIYYEYFDARQNPTQPTPVDNSNQLLHNNQQTEYILNNVTPNYKQEKKVQRPQNAYLPVKQYENDYYYVTPKPEIIPNGVSNSYQPVTLKPSVSASFDQEIENIQKTLQYYNKNNNNNNQYSTHPPRTPKAKTVYDYPYNPIKEPTRRPEIQYDTSPFKPILPFSSPYDNTNGFKAIPYQSTSTTETSINPYTYISSAQYDTTPRYVQSHFRQKTLKANQIRPQHGYSTLPPLNYKQYINYDDTLPKYQYSAADGLDVTENYPTTTLRNPWVTIEKHTVRELPQYPVESSTIHNTRPQRPRVRYNNGNTNYNYNSRPANEYYTYNADTDFTQQVNSLRTQIYKQNHSQRLIQQQQQQQQQPQQQQYHQPQISLINDTYVNYQQPRPNLNPHSEYIQPTTQAQYSPLLNPYYQNAHQVQQPQQPPAYQPPNLHKDTAVNYKYPLPPVNKNAEYITPQEFRNKYKNNQQNPIIEYRLGNDQSQVYFITPREMKYGTNQK